MPTTFSSPRPPVSPCVPDRVQAAPPRRRVAQLPLDLRFPERWSFDDFLAEDTLEVLATLRTLVRNETGERQVYLWGAAGAGKTHLLRAAVAEAHAQGCTAWYWDLRTSAQGEALDAWLEEPLPDKALLAIDHIEALSHFSPAEKALSSRCTHPLLLLGARGEKGEAGRSENVEEKETPDSSDPDSSRADLLFRVMNRFRTAGRALLLAGRLPVHEVALREEVRNRLGWGLVYALAVISDECKADVLQARAAQRGLRASAELCRWLVQHRTRDLRHLLWLLDALDRVALARQRPLSRPFVGEVLREIDAAAVEADVVTPAISLAEDIRTRGTT